jgi:hypothetical protein
MSDLLHLQEGARPWLPADDVRPLDTLNEYNIPLAGLIEQGGTTFLYSCLLGELEELNIWAYVLVDESESERLMSLLGDDLAAAMRESLTDRPVMAALAHDHELQYWLRVAPGPGGALGIAERFIEELRPRLEAIRHDADELARLGSLAGC